MTKIKIERTVSLNGPIMPEMLAGTLYGGEKQAHEFTIHATFDGVPVTLEGTVTALLIRRADGGTVTMQGSIQDGAAVVTLAPSCYAQPGAVDLSIFAEQSGVSVCVYSAVANVKQTSTDTIIDPAHIVPDIQDVIAMMDDAEDAIDAANAAAQAAEDAAEGALSNFAEAFSSSTGYVTGQHVTYTDGKYYRFKDDHAAGAWTGADVDEVTVGAEVAELKSALTSMAPVKLTASDCTWTLGKNYDSTGYLANTAGFAVSSLIPATTGNAIGNTSPAIDANGKHIKFWVHEFKSNGGVWLRRTEVMSGGFIALGSETTGVRIGFGYPGIEGVTITQELVDANFSASVYKQAAAKEQVDALDVAINGKMDKAYYWDDSGATANQGIIASDGTVYNPTASYDGRYISFHVGANTDLLITGYSNNPSYPCVYIAYDDTTSDTKLKGYSTAYTDEPLTITKAGMVYVSGNTTKIPSAKAKKAVTSQQIGNTVILSESLESLPALVVTYKNSRLYVKKRISDNLSICISWSHHGANQLWDFSGIFYVDETPGSETSLDFTSNGTMIVASDTDWFGPYVVQAVNNADGDVPAGNSYNTGGNHRSNNTATGGGITAEETSFAISVNGETITNGFVNRCNEVTVKWTNAVQANNTSKSDGTGRAVLTESWTMRITDNGIFVQNDICPTEDVVIKKYYGTQAYCPTSGKVIYMGGNTRTPTAINTASNSGNKKCRKAICYNANFRFSVMVDSIDLGSFDLGGSYSFFTTSGVSKLYPLLIDGTINAAEGDHYYLEGCYKFWGI